MVERPPLNEQGQQLGLFGDLHETVPDGLANSALSSDPLMPDSSHHRVRQPISQESGRPVWIREILINGQWCAHGGYWVPETHS
jgi:hypothetical protein